jgi:uncharacterized membrane protein YfhO
MWLSGYRAIVNGKSAEVRRSPDNLVMVALPPGRSTIALDYFAPWWLHGVYWICLVGWSSALVFGVRRITAVARTFPC